MKNDSRKISLSVYGSQQTPHSKSFEVLEKAENLGSIIAEHNCVLTIPATSGFPLWVARGAYTSGGHVIGFSPAANEEEHTTTYHLPTKYMDAIIYSGFGFAGSDLLLSRSSDAIIFGYGGLETVHEFWVAFQENKPIGILRGEWDTDEILFELLRGQEDRFDHNRIIFDDNPQRLVEQLIKKARNNSFHHYHIKNNT